MLPPHRHRQRHRTARSPAVRTHTRRGWSFFQAVLDRMTGADRCPGCTQIGCPAVPNAPAGVSSQQQVRHSPVGFFSAALSRVRDGDFASRARRARAPSVAWYAVVGCIRRERSRRVQLAGQDAPRVRSEAIVRVGPWAAADTGDDGIVRWLLANLESRRRSCGRVWRRNYLCGRLEAELPVARGALSRGVAELPHMRRISPCRTHCCRRLRG